MNEGGAAGRSRKDSEGLLARMAESAGLTLVSVSGDAAIAPRWYVGKKAYGDIYRLTISYFSPEGLLSKLLTCYRAFYFHDERIPNPFFGMSPEEVELRLAVAGA